MHFSIDRTVHTTAFNIPVVDHWLERKIATSNDSSTTRLYPGHEIKTLSKSPHTSNERSTTRLYPGHEIKTLSKSPHTSNEPSNSVC